jgi:PAS domain S-box-containing protein
MVASQVITNVKEAEIAISKSQYLLRKIIDTAPIFISRIDKNGYYLIANESLSKAVGIPCDLIVGKHYRDVVPDGMVDHFEKAFESVKKEGRLDNTVQMFNHQRNKFIYNQYILNRIKDDEGNFDGVVIIGVDVTDQKEIEIDLTTKNTQINESIQYATRIQNGILGDRDDLKLIFPESFVFFQPKDILSGDFYWCADWSGKQIIIAADCTGHGVPGALMTIIGINFINEIVYTYGMTKPDLILHQLDQKVTDTLINSNAKEKIQDGLDISVIVIDRNTNKLQFSGAKNPLFICKANSECTRIRGSKYPIGSTHYGTNKDFGLTEINLEDGDMIYIYSDGFQDQMGGHNGKKYMAKNFRDYLEIVSSLDVSKQELLIEKSFNEWKANRDQTDDVLVMGLRYRK